MTPVGLCFSSLVSTSCPLGSVIFTCRGNPDEAHKGKGNYAYAQIIRELMHKNPHFRVLALTATPGSKPEDVQELCDALHISHIEIRDELSPDLKQYLFQKVWFVSSTPEHFVDIRTPIYIQEIEQHIVNMSGEILQIRVLLAELMEVLYSLTVLRLASELRMVSR